MDAWFRVIFVIETNAKTQNSELMENLTRKWYAIPPYKKTEMWNIVDDQGEYIAETDDRLICEHIVDAHNNQLNK